MVTALRLTERIFLLAIYNTGGFPNRETKRSGTAEQHKYVCGRD